MCGRYSLTDSGDLVVKDLRVRFLPPGWQPRYNIAPGQEVLTVRLEAEERVAVLQRWGLIPSWAKDPSVGHRMINARAETVGEKPAFRSAFRRRRCLLPADGFYEWRRVGDRKQPVRFRLRSGGLMAFAGLWEVWQGPEGPVTSCTILTTAANELVAPVHDRMPVILGHEERERWLDASLHPVELQQLLRPYATAAMEAYDVSTLVNSPRNDLPQCIEPLSQGA